MSREASVRAVYEKWIKGWNNQDAGSMAACLTSEAHVVGFDGTEMKGRETVQQAMADIFKHHPTGLYVTIIRDLRFPLANVALLRAAVGMVPRTGTDVNPAVNAIQTMMLAEHGGQWLVEAFQNTPAAFHGRPQDVLALTNELRGAMNAQLFAKI